MRLLPARTYSLLPVVLLSLTLASCGEKSSPSSLTSPGPGPTPTPTPEPGPGTPPAAITAFAAVAGDGQVTLHWRLPADTSVVATVIRRKAGATPSGPTDGEAVYDGNDTTVVDHSVTNGTSYTYGAWTRSSGGAFTGPVVATARPLPPPPAAPGNLTATAGAHSVALAWQNPGGSFDHVRVMVKAGAYPADSTDGTLVYEGKATTATATNLTANVAVYVSAWAIDAFGQASGAAHATATPTFEYQNLAVPAWGASHLFPVHPATGAGDRDFAGHGPHVTAHLHYERDGANLNAVLDYRAEETAGGDGTWAAKTFTWTRATVPAGWTFDAWVDSIDQTVEYTDTNLDRDRFPPSGSFAAALPIEHIEFVGDTEGDDVGSGTTKDDTQIWQINARARAFRVRR